MILEQSSLNIFKKELKMHLITKLYKCRASGWRSTLIRTSQPQSLQATPYYQAIHKRSFQREKLRTA